MLPDLSRSHGVVKKREALEELVGTVGWQIFRSYALAEWIGLGYVQRMRAALKKDAIEPQVVDRASLEILRLLDWPTNQVHELKGSAGDE